MLGGQTDPEAPKLPAQGSPQVPRLQGDEGGRRRRGALTEEYVEEALDARDSTEPWTGREKNGVLTQASGTRQRPRPELVLTGGHLEPTERTERGPGWNQSPERVGSAEQGGLLLGDPAWGAGGPWLVQLRGAPGPRRERGCSLHRATLPPAHASTSQRGGRARNRGPLNEKQAGVAQR